MSMDVRTMAKLLAPVKRRVALLASRVKLALVDDAAPIQAVQVEGLAEEVMDGAERFQNYGFTSHPLPGAEGIVLSLGGHRSHAVLIVADDRRYRIALEAGEVALYSDEGDSVVLRRGRVVEINTETLRVNASTAVELNTPLVTTTGQVRADLDITDQVSTGGRSMADMRSTYNTHTHPENDSGGPTGTPNQGM